MLPQIVGVLLLVVGVYLAMKILKNLVMGVLLIGILLFASYLIFGSVPSFKQIPIIGWIIEKISPKLPTSPENIIAMIKGVAYNLDILGVNRDANGNVLISVTNTGKLSLSGFKAYVDNKKVNILNEPKDSLPSGKTIILQLDYRDEFLKVEIQTKEGASSIFEIK